MVDHWGWPRVLIVNAVTYLVSVASLWRIAYRPHAHHAALPAISWGAYLREVGDGWRVVRHSAPVGLALTALAASVTLVARTEGDPAAMVGPIKETILGIDKENFEHIFEQMKRERGAATDVDLTADHLKDIFPGQGVTVQGSAESKLMVKFKPPHSGEVVAFRIEKEIAEKGYGALHRWRVAGAQPPVYLDQRVIS